MRVINGRRGKMAFVTLDNATERVEVSLYSEKYKDYRPLLQKGRVLVVRGEFSTDEFTGGVQMRAETVTDIDTFRKDCLRRIQLDLTEALLAGDAAQTLHRLLADHRGGNTEITLRYQRAGGETGALQPPPDWRVHPTEKLLDALTELFGADHLRFYYDTSSLRNGKVVAQRPRLAAVG